MDKISFVMYILKFIYDFLWFVYMTHKKYMPFLAQPINNEVINCGLGLLLSLGWTCKIIILYVFSLKICKI